MPYAGGEESIKVNIHSHLDHFSAGVADAVVIDGKTPLENSKFDRSMVGISNDQPAGRPAQFLPVVDGSPVCSCAILSARHSFRTAIMAGQKAVHTCSSVLNQNR